jgi:hypothetical protein
MSEEQKIRHDEMVGLVFNHPRALSEFKYRLNKYKSGTYSINMVDQKHLLYVCKKYNLFENLSTYSKEVNDAHRIFSKELKLMYPFITSFLQQKNIQIDVSRRGFCMEYTTAKVTCYDIKTHQMTLMINDDYVGNTTITMSPFIFWEGLDWGWLSNKYDCYSISATQDLIYEIFDKFGGFVWFLVNGSTHFPFFPLELIELIQNYVFTKSELPVTCEIKDFLTRRNALVYKLK